MGRMFWAGCLSGLFPSLLVAALLKDPRRRQSASFHAELYQPAALRTCRRGLCLVETVERLTRPTPRELRRTTSRMRDSTLIVVRKNDTNRVRTERLGTNTRASGLRRGDKEPMFVLEASWFGEHSFRAKEQPFITSAIKALEDQDSKGGSFLSLLDRLRLIEQGFYQPRDPP